MQFGPLVLHSHRIESAKKLTHYHRRSSCLQEKQGASLPGSRSLSSGISLARRRQRTFFTRTYLPSRSLEKLPCYRVTRLGKFSNLLLLASKPILDLASQHTDCMVAPKSRPGYDGPELHWILGLQGYPRSTPTFIGWSSSWTK